MPLYYVTGVTGSGKSTILAELKRRGYTTYEVDDLAAFYNKHTGEKSNTGHTAEERTPAWRAHHEWKIPPSIVKTLATETKNQTAFLCGVTGNDAEFWDQFAQVFCLYVPAAEIEWRLRTRPDENAYGKNPLELTEAIEWAKYAREQYAGLGATIIDATQPIEKVVDDIVHHVAQENSTAI